MTKQVDKVNKTDALEQLLTHINVSNKGHYSHNGFETKDIIEAMGIAEDAYLFAVIKYITRFPKTRNKKDLLKAAHYCLMLIDYLDREET